MYEVFCLLKSEECVVDPLELELGKAVCLPIGAGNHLGGLQEQLSALVFFRQGLST